MDDLEMTHLCAEAMDYQQIDIASIHGRPAAKEEMYVWVGGVIYDPLRNDALAMELIKRFGLVCDPQHDGQDFAADPGWEVWHESLVPGRRFISPSLNMAAVECVATMQLETTQQEAATMGKD